MRSPMSRPARRAVLALLLAALLPGAPGAAAQALPPAAPAAVGLSAARLDSLGRTLRAYVDEGRLPGGVLLVARKGRLARLDAFGWRDVEAREPMEADDLFRIASQTKAVVSVAAMRLEEEGRLSLDDPLSRWIPAFDSVRVAEAAEGSDPPYRVVPARRPITVRHLLTHTSGLGYGGGPAAERWAQAGIEGWYFADREEPVAATVERMAALPLEAHPGERWVYGYSIDALGVVVERASGLRLDAALRAYVLAPLGMEDTWFYPPPSEAERLATVYSAGEDGRIARSPSPGGMVGQGMYLDGPRASFSGGAGLVSTARDYGRFLQMLLNGGTLDGTRLLSPESVAAMTADVLAPRRGTPDLYGGDPRGFGLGFEVVLEPSGDGSDPRRAGAFGWGGAYHSTYWVDPAEALVVVYLTQVIPAGRLDDHQAVRRGVYEALDATR